MKKELLIASLSLACYSAGWAQNNTFTLNGHLEHTSAADKAYLQYGGKTDSTAIASDGTFHFTGTVNEPAKAYLLIGPNAPSAVRGNKYTQIYLEPTLLTIEGQKDSLANIHLQGGNINTDYQQYKDMLKPVNEQTRELGELYRNTEEEKRETPEFKETYTQKNQQIAARKKEIVMDFIKQHPDSQVGLDAIIESAGYAPDIAYIEPAYNLLSKNVKESPAGQRYAKEIENIRKTRVGVEAPQFSMIDTLGNIVSLADFRGKYVLIDFWASWCGPCRAENPNVVKAYQQYKDKGFTVLGVSLDDAKGREAWLKAIKNDQLNWTQVSDLKGWQNEAAKLYAIKAIPQNFLIDPQGIIVAKNLRGEALQSKLKEIFH